MFEDREEQIKKDWKEIGIIFIIILTVTFIIIFV